MVQCAYAFSLCRYDNVLGSGSAAGSRCGDSDYRADNWLLYLGRTSSASIAAGVISDATARAGKHDCNFGDSWGYLNGHNYNDSTKLLAPGRPGLGANHSLFYLAVFAGAVYYWLLTLADILAQGSARYTHLVWSIRSMRTYLASKRIEIH